MLVIKPKRTPRSLATKTPEKPRTIPGPQRGQEFGRLVLLNLGFISMVSMSSSSGGFQAVMMMMTTTTMEVYGFCLLNFLLSVI